VVHLAGIPPSVVPPPLAHSGAAWVTQDGGAAVGTVSTPQARPPRILPLNAGRDFAAWPHLNPGQWIDTNPTFIRLSNDARWVMFCRYTVPPEPGRGSIWVVRVDIRMEPRGIPTQLIGQGIDPRAIRIGERTLIFYTIIERDPEDTVNGSSVALAEFKVNGDRWTYVAGFVLPKRPIQKPLSTEANENWEKNWVPFPIDESRVGLIYSHDPWDIITLNIEPDKAPHLESIDSSPPIQWDYGTIRGGTPPVTYDDEHLITFFHSAQVIGSRRVYSVGACVFMVRAPYRPVSMTSNPLLMAPYRTGAHRFGWHFAGSVVFPLGAERTAECYTLLCGRDDGEIATFAVLHDELRPRLSPPQAGPTGTVHDYRGGSGARLPLKGLLYVPDPIPGIPELPMINFIRTVASPGRTFVDVGAHIGFYTMGLAPSFERVIAFEPSRLQYGWLKRNQLLNAYDHVACEHVALGGAAGTATLNVLSYEGGLNTLAPEVASRMTILDQYEVPVDVLDRRGMTDVDLIKIDVEGFEIEVLSGATLTINASRPVILIEVWVDVCRRREVQAVMNDLNYSLEFLFPMSPELAVCLPRERRHEFQWLI
jgi:FkbM family methyltransferase